MEDSLQGLCRSEIPMPRAFPYWTFYTYTLKATHLIKHIGLKGHHRLAETNYFETLAMKAFLR